MKREPYLLDKKFLKKLDNENVKTLIARITILSWDEKPIADFTGKVLPGGTLNLDGNSSMRRTCNLSLSLDENEINITKVENLISINKKVTLEIGVYNTLNNYKEFEIIWFPLGVYVMIQPSISRSTSGTTLSLQLKDKMCLLNGEVGGTLPASITLSEMGYTDNDGNEFIEHPTIFQIIFELVNHFGGEQLGNIIISDLDTRIRKVMKWNSSNYPLYWKEAENSNSDYRQFLYVTEAELEQRNDQTGWQTYEFNEDVGFIYTDFIWPEEELIADVGETICGVLDKITGMLSNFEYFYDIYGKFHFQEKKNYLNTTQATTFTRQMQRLNPTNGSRRYTLISQNDYLIDLSNGKAEYIFDDNNLITSYTNVPQFNLIKNDFLIWGLRKTADGTTLPIRYHLAIDKKPQTGIPHIVVLYKDKSDGLIKAASAEDKDSKDGEYKLGHFYCEAKKSKVIFIDENIEKFTYAGNDGVVWISLLGLDATLYKYDFVEENGVKTNRKELIRVEQKEGEIYLAAIVPNDWRTELYLQGIEAEATATDSNYYYPELLNEWPKLFDLEKNRFRTEILADPSSMDYYLDFIDSNSAIGEFSVNNIGRRTYATVDDKINCVFSNSLQTECIILKPGETATEAITKGEYGYSNVSDDVYKNLVQGGNQNSAFGKVREMLYQYTSYCENITLQAIPIYYLDVNTRITVQDIKSNIFGDYLIARITLPLDCNGLMTINATRALDRDKAIINPPEQIVEGRNNEFAEFSNRIDHIKITQLPNKLSYLENELIDITGIIVHGYDIDNNDLGIIPESLINHTIYARNPNSNQYTININVNLNNKLMTDSYFANTVLIEEETLFLYNYANTYDNITGGYQAEGRKSWENGVAITPTISIETDNTVSKNYHRISETATSNWQIAEGVYETINEIDLTNYKSINIVIGGNYSASSGTGQHALLKPVLSKNKNIVWTPEGFGTSDGKERYLTYNMPDTKFSYNLPKNVESANIGILNFVNTGYMHANLKSIWLSNLEVKDNFVIFDTNQKNSGFTDASLIINFNNYQISRILPTNGQPNIDYFHYLWNYVDTDTVLYISQDSGYVWQYNASNNVITSDYPNQGACTVYCYIPLKEKIYLEDIYSVEVQARINNIYKQKAPHNIFYLGFAEANKENEISKHFVTSFLPIASKNYVYSRVGKLNPQYNNLSYKPEYFNYIILGTCTGSFSIDYIDIKIYK